MHTDGGKGQQIHPNSRSIYEWRRGQSLQKEKVQQEEKMKNMEERLNFLSDSQFAMISTIQEMSKKDKKTMKKFISIYEKDFKNISDFENS